MSTDVSGLLAPLMAFLLALLASAVDARVTQIWWAVDAGAELLAKAAVEGAGESGPAWVVTAARTAAAAFWAVVLSLSAAAVLLPLVGEAVAERLQAPGSPEGLAREATRDTPLFRVCIPEGARVTGQVAVDDSLLGGDRIFKPPAALSGAAMTAAAAARVASSRAGSAGAAVASSESAVDTADALLDGAAETGSVADGDGIAGTAVAADTVDAGPAESTADAAAAGVVAEGGVSAATASAAGAATAEAAAASAEFPVPKDLLPVLKAAATDLRAAGLEEEALRAEGNAAWLEAQLCSPASE